MFTMISPSEASQLQKRNKFLLNCQCLKNTQLISHSKNIRSEIRDKISNENCKKFCWPECCDHSSALHYGTQFEVDWSDGCWRFHEKKICYYMLHFSQYALPVQQSNTAGVLM